MRYCIVLILCVAQSFAWTVHAVDFEADIAPIFQKHCAGCHAGDDAEGEFALDSLAGLMAGGKKGSAITPGSISSSRLWLMVSGKLEPKMPPEDEDSLSEGQLELIAAWIEQGAKVSDDQMQVRRQLRTPRIESQVETDLPITAMASSPDGSIQAMASFNKIRLVRKAGSAVVTIEGNLGKVNSLQFSGDGSRLLVASGTTGAFGIASIFDVGSGKLIQEMLGHRDILYCAAYSPDQSLVATAGYDQEIILWNAQTGQPVRSLLGHNGAIFDLAFSPDGKVLVSACADETVKVWNVETGERLDTLSQPEAEVYAVDVTTDGTQIIAVGADNRLRAWSLISTDLPQINPLLATRFVDDSPLVNFRLAPNGKSLVVLSQSGNVKVIRTADWNQAAALEPLGETPSDLIFDPDGRSISISLMNGAVVNRQLPEMQVAPVAATAAAESVHLDLGDLEKLIESELRENNGSDPINVDRGVQINGTISTTGEVDRYQWSANAGEVWAIDADASDESPIDPIVTILDSKLQPVLRIRLQAVRDSYFTFRGKDSSQVNDFRLFNWGEMNLNDYLYASGEVTRLFRHPRGPDSGFDVYPGDANRWTYFGTSGRAHALGEPAYIVRPIVEGETPTANGLPVFDVYYENDDDPMRNAGKNSRLLFTAPKTDQYTVGVTDTRAQGGESYAYRLSIRPANPRFQPSFSKPNTKILKGAGREFEVRVERFDGFDGPVTFQILDLPPGLVSNSPVTIQQGNRSAEVNLWADESIEGWEGEKSIRVIAQAKVGDRIVERKVGVINGLTIGDRPSAIASIHPIDHDVPENESWKLQIRRSETAMARIKVRRKEGFNSEIRFGNEKSGRNTSHGVYVDNIGLSGLLVREGETEREFFLTADPVAVPGERLFHLQAAIDGNVTTFPIVVEVLP